MLLPQNLIRVGIDLLALTYQGIQSDNLVRELSLEVDEKPFLKRHLFITAVKNLSKVKDYGSVQGFHKKIVKLNQQLQIPPLDDLLSIISTTETHVSWFSEEIKNTNKDSKNLVDSYLERIIQQESATPKWFNGVYESRDRLRPILSSSVKAVSAS